ncbi:hypothetical protein GTA08_BOTSDO11621 [Neofusicoccum parvum]|nr:hypothetical protein GTA08_BOTSDO11621 [Neofusicoccum parvum]
MRFSFAAAFALSSLFMGALSAPTTEVGLDVVLPKDIEARDAGVTTVYSVLTDVYGQIQVHTGKINGTYAGFTKSPSQSQKNTAMASIKIELSGICDTLTSATTKLHGCEAGAESEVIIGLIAKIILEIIYTINGCVLILGTSVLSILGFALSLVLNVVANLLLVVEEVVGGVLALVWGIIDGILNLVFPGVGLLFFGLGNTLHGECGCINQ